MAKKGFYPATLRTTLLGDVGFEWQLRRSFENSKKCGGLSSSAHADLVMAIECILVGLNEPATHLLEKARTWAGAALSSDSEIPGWLTFETLALCEWILSNHHDERMYQNLTDEHYRMATTQGVADDAVSVSLALPSFVDAGDYKRALELFERTRKLAEPDSLDKVRNEGQLCYAIAKHRLGLGYTEEEVAIACDKFMSKSMNKWLIDGHTIRAAEWMKIIWANHKDVSLSANETILKCYDYLRNCQRPQ